jgi:hypothetical protein
MASLISATIAPVNTAELKDVIRVVAIIDYAVFLWRKFFSS